MPEVHSVYATVRLPTNGDTGQVTTGYYTLGDGVLTMTDSQGAPVRDLNNGEMVTHKVKEGEDPRSIASRLTLKIYRMMRSDGMAGFNRYRETEGRPDGSHPRGLRRRGQFCNSNCESAWSESDRDRFDRQSGLAEATRRRCGNRLHETEL